MMTRRGLLSASVVAVVADGAVQAADQRSITMRLARLGAIERLDIQDLFARYAWSYDCSDEPSYLDCYTDDAMVIGANPGQVFRGKEAIGGWFRYLVALREKEGDDWLHDAYHHRFYGDRKRCVVFSYATHFNSNQPAQRRGVRSAGYFVSECVQQRDGWRMRRHSVNTWDRHSLPWSKPLPWAQHE